MDTSLDRSVDTLEAGMTVLFSEDERSSAHHRLVLAHLRESPGQVLWIDARDTASTYTLNALSRHPGELQGIEIARAWTAYQHHTLVRDVVDRADTTTALVVLPNLCSLYRDDDLARGQGEWLLTSSLATVSELADVLDVPVLLTAVPDERDVLDQYTDRELRWQETSEGARLDGDGSDHTIYRRRWWWQTTIPYWIDLLGTSECMLEAVDPFTEEDSLQTVLAAEV